MATVLDVVNDCLATLGEAPLNSLLEPHEFRGAAQRELARINTRTQDRGWWFNTEAASYTPNPDGHIYLPGDCIKWQSGVRSKDMLVRSQAKPWIVQRGRQLYDTRTQSYVLTDTVVGEIIREIPFADLPSTINDLIAIETVLTFQSNFDADNSRRQELTQRWAIAKADANAENVRQLAVNMIANNSRLARIKSVTRRVRG